MTRSVGDEVLVRRAARKVAAQVAVLVGAAMLLLIVLVTVVVVRGQSGAADDLLRSTLATADDVGDPPPGVWLVMVGRSGEAVSPGFPAGLRADLERLRATAGDEASLVDVQPSDDGAEYRIATRTRDGDPIQAVLDLTTAHQDRTRLFQAMAGPSAAGLLFAALLGLVVGRRAVRPLAQALALQRTFVADAAHELRTPLTLLSTRAQVLDRALRRSGIDDELLRDSGGVVQDAQRLGEVVEDLLVAADPRHHESHSLVDLGRLTEAVADSARAHASSTGVGIRWEAHGDRLRVLGSVGALRRALLALIDNAIDHSPRDGEVRIVVHRAGRDVVVSVRDTGPGIRPEDADRVLRRFDSGGQRAGRAHYGLGLALTHDVANRHGGQLRLVGGEAGATFELVVPAFDGGGPGQD